MSKDYYQILGLSKTASPEEIKSAFRKLAHQYHPDKGSGNEAKFKEVSEAYSVLSDPAKRQQYDTFGSAGPSGSRGGANYGGFNGFGGQDFGGFDFSQFTQGNGQGFEFDLGDIFGEFFGGGRRVRRGRDVSLDIEISFRDSIFGLTRKIALNGPKVKQKEIELQIPAGIENGQRLKLSQMGEVLEGGVPGDLYVNIAVKRDPLFRKEGANIVTEINLKLTDAIMGRKYPLQTLDGDIELSVPEGVNNGDVLRVRGKGVPLDSRHRGDLLVKVKVVMPNRLSKTAKRLIDELRNEGV